MSSSVRPARRPVLALLGLVLLGATSACIPPRGQPPVADLSVAAGPVVGSCQNDGSDDFCQGTFAVTVTNTGSVPTDIAPTVAIEPDAIPGQLVANLAQGTCDDGPLDAGLSCTATVNLSGGVPSFTAGSWSGTVSASAGSVSDEVEHSVTIPARSEA